MNKLPKYLVRPNDFNIFYLVEREGDQLYTSDERWIPHKHFTFENLTENYDFFPITEEQVPEYEEKCSDHYGFVSWQSRNDGHGGCKGGSREEYDEYLERVKRFNEKYPNWKNE